eukprot:gene13618-16099_t
MSDTPPGCDAARRLIALLEEDPGSIFTYDNFTSQYGFVTADTIVVFGAPPSPPPPPPPLPPPSPPPPPPGLGCCKDFPEGWVDGDGYACQSYTEKDWCEDGAKGPGWLEHWGEFGKYAVDGLSPEDTCCAASDNSGGGNDLILIIMAASVGFIILLAGVLLVKIEWRYRQDANGNMRMHLSWGTPKDEKIVPLPTKDVEDAALPVPRTA